jgi:hypothetical protein
VPIRAALIFGLIGFALATAGPASGGRGSTTFSPGWADEPSVSTALERRGVVYNGRRWAVDLASCVGLRRFGKRVVHFYEQFHRFECSLWAADGLRYTAWVRIPRSNASAFWWVIYRAQRI